MPEIMKTQIPDAPDNSYASRSVEKKEVKQPVDILDIIYGLV